SKTSDTICRCKPQFFLSRSNICKPCNSCTGEECLHCHSPVTTPPTSSGLSGTLVLGILVVIFGIISILYIVNKVGKLVQQNRAVSCFYSCVSLPQTTKEPVSEVSKTMGIRAYLTLSTNLGCDSFPSLFTDPAILYTVVDHVPPSRWKEFVRRLGLSDYDLERIELDHQRLRDAQYEMLRLWKLQMSRAATVEHISCVLNQMELSGCSDAIQEALLNQNSPQPCSLHNHL
ncbi:TNR1A factor, partial [Neodrepanis coruscans]|nr:TNR1A factor [Neodrepanis coruscans]